MRILVAEDEPFIRFDIVEALADAGFEIMDASDGQAALKLINKPERFAAILTDFYMPGADGIEIAAEARQRHPGTPVVLMTGHLDLPAEQRIGPPFVMLSKPFSMAQLIAAVESVTGMMKLSYSSPCQSAYKIDPGSACKNGSDADLVQQDHEH